MSTSIIVMGACGRMGRVIAELARADEAFALAGLVDSRAEALAGEQGVATGATLAEVLPQCPGAVVIDFTAPAVSLANARLAAEKGTPLVSAPRASRPSSCRSWESWRSGRPFSGLPI